MVTCAFHSLSLSAVAVAQSREITLSDQWWDERAEFGH